MSSDLLEGSSIRKIKKTWTKKRKLSCYLAAHQIDWMRARGFWTFLRGYIFNFFLSIRLSSDSWHFFSNSETVHATISLFRCTILTSKRLDLSIWLSRFRSIIYHGSSRSKLERRSRNSIVNFFLRSLRVIFIISDANIYIFFSKKEYSVIESNSVRGWILKRAMNQIEPIVWSRFLAFPRVMSFLLRGFTLF